MDFFFLFFESGQSMSWKWRRWFQDVAKYISYYHRFQHMQNSTISLYCKIAYVQLYRQLYQDTSAFSMHCNKTTFLTTIKLNSLKQHQKPSACIFFFCWLWFLLSYAHLKRCSMKLLHPTDIFFSCLTATAAKGGSELKLQMRRRISKLL